MLLQNVKEVWESRSLALLCHYTPAYTHNMWRKQAKTYTHVYVTQGGYRGGEISPLKLMKVTLFTMILYNSENNIRDWRPSIYLSQQCCEVYFISLTVATKPL